MVFVSGPTLLAQSRALLTRPVNESERVVLQGNTHPLTKRAEDRGTVPASTPAERMMILLKRGPGQELALRSAIEALHDSNSPAFHKWLTPAEFGARWGAADSDIAAVTAWLESHGFRVEPPPPGRTTIEFSGTAGQIQEAFHTSIHTYVVHGETHHANASDPQIPAALAPVVAGISTLNDFHPRSMARKGPRGIYDLKTHTARPELTASGNSGDFLYVGPADAATIYDMPNKALNPAATGATIDGTGAIIGVIGDSNISLAQNANYRKLFGLAAKTPKVIIDGSTNPGENSDAVEAYLDTEVANGIAPNAQVYFYIAADTSVDYGLDLATLRAVNDNFADVLNLSFGECEGALTTSGNQFYESIWEQAVAQGISVTVSTGDSGSAGCDDPNSQDLAYYGLQVNGLASTPFNIAVGGTDFAVLAGPDGSGVDFPNYVSLNNDPKTLRSALGFIPEVPWNDSIESYPPGPIASAVALADPDTNIEAASGGVSNCAIGAISSTGSLECTSGYSKPSWQSGKGVPNDHARDIPDVSLFAANGYYFASWGICTDQDGDGSGNAVEDCTPGSNGLPSDEFYIYGVGGTSASAPAFAGILALVKQSTGERQGQANYVLYHLARKAASSFHDVTTGNNSVPCEQNSTDCVANRTGADFLTGYNAGAGFDLATGLGSVDVSALIAGWTAVGLLPTTTQLTLAPTSIQHGEAVIADATVTSQKGTATGEVALSAEANPPSFPQGKSIGAYELGAGGSTGQVSVNYLPGGSYDVVATYGGSAQLASSVSSPIAMTVTPESSTTAVTESAYNPFTGAPAPNGTVPYGFFLNLIAQPYGNRSPVVNGVVHPDGTATGTVTFTIGGTDLGTQPVSLEGYAEVAGSFLSPGNQTVAALYHGDASFDPSKGTDTFTVTKGATQLTLTASTTKYAGKPITFNMTLSTLSAAAAPKGTVSLVSGSTILAQTPLIGTAASDSSLAAGTATITTTNLPYGTAPIQALYLGDARYAQSASAVILLEGKPGFKLFSTKIELPAEHSTGDAVVKTISEGSYAGTINYTCVLETPVTNPTPAECAMYPASETLKAGGVAYPEVLIFGKGTKLPTGVTQGSNARPIQIGIGAGSMALACCLLFGIPARRRGWRTLLSVILLLIAVSGFTACVATPKMITHGNYTFKVTGTDSQEPLNTSTATVQAEVL